jgi:Tol biopolymer transport system component
LLVGHDTDTIGGDWWDDRHGSPSWSPDGQHIAFQFRGVSVPNSKIYIVDADGSGPRRLTDSEDGQHELQPSWSPAGPAIAYINYGLFEYGSIVKVVNVDPDGEQSQIVLHSAENYETGIHPDSNLAWSPDGNAIAFTAGTESQAGIWVLDTGTGNVSRFFPGAFDPSWGPDGRIAFASWEYCANEWIVSIWVSGSGQTPSNFYHGPTRASSLRVGVGGKLTWVSRNQLSPFISHIVSTSHPPGGTSFDSGIMQPGDTFSFIPGVEGTWAYVDQYNGLTGTFTASAGTSLPGLNCSSTGDIE